MNRVWRVWAFILVFAASAQAQELRIASVSFTGNSRFNAVQLENKIQFARVGAPYRADILEMDIENIENFYKSQGFLSARVGPPVVTPGGTSVTIRLPVSEGPLFTLGKLTITGVRALGTETMQQMCPARTGQPYSRTKLADWEGKIADAYHEMGYLRFESNVREDVRPRETVVDCVLEISEGKPYTVGKISIAGNASISLSDLKRRLMVSEGGVFNRDMFLVSLQYLNRMRTYPPILESDVELQIDDTRNTVDLIFHFDKQSS